MNKPFPITSDTACLVRERVNKACLVRQSEGTASPGSKFEDIACPVRQSEGTASPGREFVDIACPVRQSADTAFPGREFEDIACPVRQSWDTGRECNFCVCRKTLIVKISLLIVVFSKYLAIS